MKKYLSFIALFSSASTLICCALPALFVSLGAGATFVSVLGVFPQLIWFSEHKPLVFGIAGMFLLLAGFARWNASERSCPTDPELAKSCGNAKSVSGVIYYLSLALYCTGAFFAFLAPKIF